MRKTARLLSCLSFLLVTSPALAQFADTEVSALGQAPFLWSKTGSVFEDLGPGVEYNLYRRAPGGTFECLEFDLPTPAWTGDPTDPPASTLWMYAVNGWDGTDENLHGSSIPIGTACHVPPPVDTGACCDGSGGCTEISRDDCLVANGHFQGDLSSCSAVPAPCACGSTGPPPAASWSLFVFAGGRLVDITAPLGSATNRMFIVDANGLIQILEDGVQLATPFLNIGPRVQCCGEQGLLGLAFHPDYMANGLFYVNYTDNGGDTVVSEFQVTADPNVADPNSERILITINQPAGNHNGGGIAFGLDGYLYIGMGDGGGGCDSASPDAGQDIDKLLGSMLRIDITPDGGGNQYSIPPDNPFVGVPGRDEIWTVGMRNPWRFSIDRATGDLWMGDVGQGGASVREEVDVQHPWDNSGANYGWVCMEGTLHDSCNRGAAICGAVPDPSWKLPVYEWRGPGQPGGCSAVGGHVYRGSAIPGLQGHYFYADFCGNWIRSLRYVCDQAEDVFDWPNAPNSPTAFGEDSAGELYLTTLGGGVYRLEP